MKPFPVLLFALLLSLVAVKVQAVALNDEFVTRQVLTGPLPLAWSGYAGGLTADLTDALAASGGDLDECGIEGTMWFEWTAPEAGVYLFRGEAPFMVTVLAAPPAGEAQVPSPELVIAKEQGDPGPPVKVAAGQRLWILLSHEGDPIPGDRTSLTISRLPVAPSSRETAQPLALTPGVPFRYATQGEGWWRWRAPRAGTWRLRPYFMRFDFFVERADGTSTNAVQRSFTTTEGEELYIRSLGTGLGLAEVTIEPFETPRNHTPETAIPLVPDATGAGYFFESLSWYLDSGAPQWAWFSWVAPRDGVAGFLPGAMETHFKAYRDDNGVLTQIDAPDGGSERNPYATVTAGRRYLISIPFSYTYKVRVEYLENRGSDSFAGAPEITPGEYPRDYFGDSGTEPGEPGISGTGDKTRWWKYTAPVDGLLSVAGYRVNVYSGESLAALTLLASASPEGGVSPAIETRAGTVYRVQVFESLFRSAGLTYFIPGIRPRSSSDQFADAAPLMATPVNAALLTTLDLSRLTAEPGEPPVAPGVPATRTAWMRWTAGTTGRMVLVPEGVNSEAPPVMEVWKGDRLATLERVPSSPFEGQLWSGLVLAFDAVAGTVYSFQVEAVPGDTRYFFHLYAVFADPGKADAFASPLRVESPASGFGLEYAVTSRATFEAWESTEGLPAPAEGFTSGSYWLRWTAPADGVWRVAPPYGWYEGPGPVMTIYGESLEAGRLALFTNAGTGPVFLKLRRGESLHIGNVVYQSLETPLKYTPLFPEISPAVPGIALAGWYGLPVPADLGAAYSGDGIPLLVKHALGLDPLRNSLPGGDDPGASRWPVLEEGPEGDVGLSFRLAPPFQTGAGVDLTGEISSDLLTWLPAPETVTEGGKRVSLPRTGSGGFLRLRATMR